MDGNTLANKSAVDRSKTEFYPMPKEATIALLKFINIPKEKTILEPACGEGHMSEVIKSNGYNVISSDINDMGYGIVGVDFLIAPKRKCDWIITNPPFRLSESFIHRSIEYSVPFALLLKSQYWHSKKRYKIFNEYKPKYVLPLTWRPDFLFGRKGGAPTMECLWTVWDSKPSEITQYIPLCKPDKI